MSNIKKSPLEILFSIVWVDSLVLLLYIASAVVFRYLSENEFDLLAANKVFQFNLISVASIFIFQMVLFTYLFLDWYYEVIQVTKNSFIHKKGLIMKYRRVVPLQKIEMIEFNQSPVGKLFKYGTVILKTKVYKKKGLKISYVNDPDKCVSLLQDVKEGKEKKVKEERIVPEGEELDINKLLKQRENGHVEFKASMRWGLKEKKVNKKLEKVIMKTLAGFMNSKGGYLLVGVNDDATINGLEKDYKSLPRKDRDGFENHFNQVFNDVLGVENRQFINIEFYEKSGKDICAISVIPSFNPVYVTDDNKEDFYVRTGNTTSPLSLRKAMSYIKTNWKEN